MLVAGDELQLASFAGYIEIGRLAITVENPPQTTQLIVRIQDQSGVSPANFIEATIPAGQHIGASIGGRVPINAGVSPILRIVAGLTEEASFLGGYFEFWPAASGVSTFASLVDVKTDLDENTSNHDAALTRILLAVTQAMQVYIGRPVIQQMYIDERHSISQDTKLLYLNHPPIEESFTPLVTLDGSPLVQDSDYIVEAALGRLYNDARWQPTDGGLLVTYVGGETASNYADLTQACIEQTIYRFRQTEPGGNRLGFQSKTTDSGGSSSYYTEAWLPSVKETLDFWRQVW